MNKINTAEILCVGTEILIGDIVNTNAAFISTRLAALGINQYYQGVVGDNPQRLSNAVQESLKRCDLLIMSGGLGPTYDDLTKETVASVMGRKLVLHQRSLDRIKSFFEKRAAVMSDNNIKQAYVPLGSIVFDNDNGTAPAVAIEDEINGKTIIMLPGPPSELIPLWNNSVEEFLRQRTSVTLVSRNINLIGIGESALEDMLCELMRKAENPTVAPYCGDGEVRLRITARSADKNTALAMCDDMIEYIKTTPAAKYIYGVDTSLVQTLIDILRINSMKITAAESCTGGLLSSSITAVPGSSDVFETAFVTYANTAKIKFLGVSEETLSKNGAVSAETAKEMAVGALKVSNADLAAAITGIAGPGGGTTEKPVGTVYISAALKRSDSKSSIKVIKKEFIGNRTRIRNLSVTAAFALLLEILRDNGLH